MSKNKEETSTIDISGVSTGTINIGDVLSNGMTLFKEIAEKEEKSCGHVIRYGYTEKPAYSIAELEAQDEAYKLEFKISELMYKYNEVANYIYTNSEMNFLEGLIGLTAELSERLQMLQEEYQTVADNMPMSDDKSGHMSDEEDDMKAINVSSAKVGQIINWSFPGDAGVGVITKIMKTGSLTSDTSDYTMEATPDDPVLVIEELEKVDDDTYRRTGVTKPKRASQVNDFRDVDIVKELEKDLGSVSEKMLDEYNTKEVYQGDDFIIYKDLDSDEVRVVGIYSNKYIDREADILTESAHKEYIDAVERGLAELPQFEIWHIDVAVGQVKSLIWSEDGFAIFAGVINKEFEDIIVNIFNNTKAKNVEMGCSHGFHVLDRDGKYIKKYRTTEISFLPLEKAANILTSVAPV